MVLAHGGEAALARTLRALAPLSLSALLPQALFHELAPSRFVYVSERAAFRFDSGERRRWAWMMSAENRASFSRCPPGTRARCAAASPSPASFLRCWPHW